MFNPHKNKTIKALVKHLKSLGCETYIDLYPDRDTDVEPIDLVFYREDLGPIGVIGKNFNSFIQGEVFSDLITRIDNDYRDELYDKERISKWCILIYADSLSYTEEKIKETMSEFLASFLRRRHQISLLQYSDEPSCKIDSIEIKKQEAKNEKE